MTPNEVCRVAEVPDPLERLPAAARLEVLAEHLDPALARHLRRLVAADSDAHRYLTVERRAQRAEDLVRELRLQVRGLEGALDRARDRRGAQ